MTQFSELGLSNELLKVLPELGIENPTPIQEEAIPILLEKSRDFIGLAQTGTGKTAAFGLPLLQNLNVHGQFTQALVLAPTRELGQQIAEQMVAFSKYLPNFRVVAVYGGASISNQIRDIKKNPQIIIATPGRLIDLIERNVIKLGQVTNLILDEADEMLNMGFKEDIDKILSHTPDTKVTWLFSATMPKEIRGIVNKYMRNPAEISVSKGNEVNTNIEHQYALIRSSDKTEALKRILDADKDMRGIIFCRTKLNTQSLAEDLAKQNYKVDALHGDLSQAQRDKVMRNFKASALQVVIATDVAARGIDVNDLTHVIHFALPDDQSYYTHRSGRTARAGKKGISLSLITKHELEKIHMFEKRLKLKFTQIQVPSISDIKEQRVISWANRVSEINTDSFTDQKLLKEAYKVLSGIDKEELIKKLLAAEVEHLSYSGSSRDLNMEEEFVRKKKTRNDSHVKFFINLGSMDNLGKREMMDFICEQTRMGKDEINNLRVQRNCSFFEIENADVKKITNCFKGLYIKGRKLRVNRDDT